MTEREFGEALAVRLRPMIPRHLQIETRRSLLYAVAFDGQGKLQLGLNARREPTRGGGTGFEQDLLVFERKPNGDTSVVPRVAIELKFGAVTTHDAIVYSEKARRIKGVYPFMRYGLILGAQKKVPGRVLRLGSDFDFIVATSEDPEHGEEQALVDTLLEEIELAAGMWEVLSGGRAVRSFRRKLVIE